VLNYTSDSSTELTNDLAAQLSITYSIATLPVQADLGSPVGPSHIVASAKNGFSHPKTGRFVIDIVINNAGVAGNQSIEKADAETFNRIYKVNVLGPLLLMQAALPYLPTDRSGRVVNVSSVSSSLGLKEQSVYGGSKAALEAMTRTWARELAERCTVNEVSGTYETVD
jgi:NAD(P)-dependent dehydrogenase (short-subunit alcohol dehydrogenase family)